MDHHCHKCGYSIEDGKPFCSQCGAPQIRVATPGPPEPIAAGDGPLMALVHETEPDFPGVSISSLPAGWSYALRPCALAAAIAVLLMFLGLNPFVAAFGTGFLAVTFSQRRNSGAPLRPAAAARLGAFSGLLLFGMSTILETFVVVVLHKGPEIRSEMMDKVQQAAARYPGPQVEPFLEFVKSPGGFAFMMVASLVFGLVAFLILGGLGGAVSAAFGRRRDRP
jgi:zinc ribbon protein